MLVHHTFQLVSEGGVDVALNYGLLRYLQDLAVLYREQSVKLNGPIQERSVADRFVDNLTLTSPEGKTAYAPSPDLAASTSTATSTPDARTTPSDASSGYTRRKDARQLPKIDTGLHATKQPPTKDIGDSFADKMPQDMLEYIPQAPPNIDIKLRVMGDATPPLEWMGVQRERALHYTRKCNLATWSIN